MVEHYLDMVGVVGSSPIVITTSPSLLTQGVLAQLGERDAGSVEVRGSIPLHSTISYLSLFTNPSTADISSLIYTSKQLTLSHHKLCATPTHYHRQADKATSLSSQADLSAWRSIALESTFGF